MVDDIHEERKRVLQVYKHDLLRKCCENPLFVYHLGTLRGKRVACWCRSKHEEWVPANVDTDGDVAGLPCHLDSIHAALLGLYWSSNEAHND